MRILLSLLCVAGLSACASYAPSVPADYKGPTVALTDYYIPEERSKAQLFYVDAVDGKQIESSLVASRRATSGQGFSVSMVALTRQVPVQPLRLKLIGTHFIGAPIHELASRAAGTFYSVEGELSFTPVEGRSYFVKGQLQKTGSFACIADASTEQCVSDKLQ